MEKYRDIFERSSRMCNAQMLSHRYLSHFNLARATDWLSAPKLELIVADDPVSPFRDAPHALCWCAALQTCARSTNLFEIVIVLYLGYKSSSA